jgi:hypothetical protein
MPHGTHVLSEVSEDVFGHKVEKRKMVKTRLFVQKECLEIWAMFSPKDGVKEMIRNASCFIILFHVNN